MAKLAEQAERYSEMVYYMKIIVEQRIELTVEERILFSVAYKNVVGNLRAASRIISSIEQREAAQSNLFGVEQIRLFRGRIETELSAICHEIIHLLDFDLIPYTASPEARIFYMKMKGDYFRYLAEIRVEENGENASDLAVAAYEGAWREACEGLPPVHPIRLGMSLSYATFYMEILNQPARAIALATRTFLAVVDYTDDFTLDFEHEKDTMLLMQLLRDFLSQWGVPVAGLR